MLRHALWMALLASTALADSKLVSVFGPGEQTEYEVSYLGLVAGRAQLTVGWPTEQFGHDVWPLVCIGETTSFGSVFPVKDRFISYWDPSARRTLGADFFVNENRKKRKEHYEYDFPNNQAIVTRQLEGQAPYEIRYDIEEGTLDLAAAGFGLRNEKLVVGAVHEMPVFLGNRYYKMQATVVGRETLKTQLGDLEVYRVTVNGAFSGKLATKGLMTLFYTADEKQLPVRAEAEFLLGKIRLDAVKYAQGRVYSGAN
ncbi:MAG: DUF3108 domain-containing protein [Archangium sp.]